MSRPVATGQAFWSGWSHPLQHPFISFLEVIGGQRIFVVAALRMRGLRRNIIDFLGQPVPHTVQEMDCNAFLILCWRQELFALCPKQLPSVVSFSATLHF